MLQKKKKVTLLLVNEDTHRLSIKTESIRLGNLLPKSRPNNEKFPFIFLTTVGGVVRGNASNERDLARTDNDP